MAGEEEEDEEEGKVRCHHRSHFHAQAPARVSFPALLVCFRGSAGAPEPCKPFALRVLLACGNSFVWFQIWLITNLPTALPPKRADNHGQLSRARLPPSFFFLPTLFSEMPAAAFPPPSLSYPCTSAGKELSGFCIEALLWEGCTSPPRPRGLRVPCCAPSSSSGLCRDSSNEAALGTLAVSPGLAVAEGEPWQRRGCQHLQSPCISSPMEKPGRSWGPEPPHSSLIYLWRSADVGHSWRAGSRGMGRDGMGQVSSGLWAALPYTAGSFQDGVFMCQKSYQVPTPILAGIPWDPALERPPWRGLQGGPQPRERAEPGCPWLRQWAGCQGCFSGCFGSCPRPSPQADVPTTTACDAALSSLLGSLPGSQHQSKTTNPPGGVWVKIFRPWAQAAQGDVAALVGAMGALQRGRGGMVVSEEKRWIVFG